MRDKETRLSISRVPIRIRENFISLANQEFEGDFGMTLKYLWDKFEDHQLFLNNFDIKLDHIIQLSKNEQEDEEEDGVIRTMSGRVVKGGI